MCAAGIGVGLGVALGETANTQRSAEFGEYRPALPSVLLDRRGKLITEYFAEERREIVSIVELPRHVLQAVVVKEDRSFFSHPGFSVKGILRAAWNIITGHYFSGGSTISQQVAGNLYDDRSVTTLGRKLSELWWSFQLEKKRSKYEILEIYLNNSKFGHGNYGVESASKFYFGHSARTLSLAEATLLAVHLSNPVTRSMINYPNRARQLQATLLDDMIALGYVGAEESTAEFDEFWASFVAAGSGETSAHTERTDPAPEFSELIRRRFEELFYGSPDLYRDGFVIHSGFDLEYQRLADSLLAAAGEQLAADLLQETEQRDRLASEVFIPTVELFGALFGIDGLDLVVEERTFRSVSLAREALLPALVMIDGVIGIGELPERVAYSGGREIPAVSGVLVAIENDTGRVLAFSTFQGGDIGAVDSPTEERRRLGSLAGPLVLAAGIDSRALTAADPVYDSPKIVLSSGAYAAVSNPAGVYRGRVSARRAVAGGLFAALASIAEKTGTTAAEAVTVGLLGDAFGPDPIVPPTARMSIDGTAATVLQVARGYAAFARGGVPPTLLSIRYVTDRNGVVVYDNEQAALRELSHTRPVISEQTAFIVRDVLAETLRTGGLSRRVAELGGMGDTVYGAAVGTTDGWTDAWVAGFSSQITVVVRFSVPEGETLGQYQTGASVAGPVWTRFMKTVHEDLPSREPRSTPQGVIKREVCAASGFLPTEACVGEVVDEFFLAGTEPVEFCDYHIERRREFDEFAQRIGLRAKLEPPPPSILRRAPDGADDATPWPGVRHERNPYID